MTAEPKAPAFKSGFVGMAGPPSAGKSTLVNRLVGSKVSIVSRRPQTTRHRICGILTDETMQAVLVDLPGILAAPSAFNEALVDCAERALKDCDFILHLRDPALVGSPDEERVLETLRKLGQPVWQVWTKIDLKQRIPQAALDEPPLPYEATYFVSAKSGKGIDALKDGIRRRLPEGPMLYPADDLSDRDLRFLAAEAVREKAFLYLQQEVPYGIATLTEEWEDRPGGAAYVRVAILTEREAHKSIIIGAGGAMLKKIGSAARREIEALADGPVFLDLRVQARPRWRKDPGELARLGLRESGE